MKIEATAEGDGDGDGDGSCNIRGEDGRSRALMTPQDKIEKDVYEKEEQNLPSNPMERKMGTAAVTKKVLCYFLWLKQTSLKQREKVHVNSIVCIVYANPSSVANPKVVFPYLPQLSYPALTYLNHSSLLGLSRLNQAF